jgi:hypothetical protein
LLGVRVRLSHSLRRLYSTRSIVGFCFSLAFAVVDLEHTFHRRKTASCHREIEFPTGFWDLRCLPAGARPILEQLKTLITALLVSGSKLRLDTYFIILFILLNMSCILLIRLLRARPQCTRTRKSHTTKCGRTRASSIFAAHGAENMVHGGITGLSEERCNNSMRHFYGRRALNTVLLGRAQLSTDKQWWPH